MHIINSPTVRDDLEMMAGGTTRQRVSGGNLKRYSVPVPPPNEQHHISILIANWFAHVAEAKNDLARVLMLTGNYSQKLLLDSFETRPKTGAWSTSHLADIGHWGSGGTPATSHSDYYGGDIPWIRSGDLRDAPISNHAKSLTSSGLKNSSAKWVKPGAVLIAMYGATIGRLGISTYPVTTNQAVAFCELDRTRLDPQFLFYYLLAIRRRLIEKGQGGAQPNISQTILKRQMISYSDLPEQARTVNRLERDMAAIRDVGGDVARACRLLDRLRRVVLSKAYSGELRDDLLTTIPVVARRVIAVARAGNLP